MKWLKLIGVVVVLTCATQISFAQPAGGGPGGPPAGGPPPCWPPPCVPVDGGLGFLIAAGIGLGGKKLYDYNKERHNKKLS